MISHCLQRIIGSLRYLNSSGALEGICLAPCWCLLSLVDSLLTCCCICHIWRCLIKTNSRLLHNFSFRKPDLKRAAELGSVQCGPSVLLRICFDLIIFSHSCRDSLLNWGYAAVIFFFPPDPVSVLRHPEAAPARLL